MIPIEDLLKPISPEKPCGNDPTYEQDFRELEVLIRGRPDSMISDDSKSAEEPNWNQIEERCLRLFEGSKHLHVAVVLTLAWLKTQGLAGFCHGLALIRGLIANYWDSVYPLLEAEFENDPTERLNILASLYTPPGAHLDYMKFVLSLRQAPLCRSRSATITASDIMKAEAKAPGAKSVGEIKSGFGEAAPAEIQASQQALATTLGYIKELDASLTRIVGSENARSWKELLDAVADIQVRLNRYAPESAVSSGASNPGATPASDQDKAAEQAPRPIPGSVQSRQDVVRSLDVICDYYRQFEPSSPIPLLLRRAQRLVDKDFLEILKDLTPESLVKIKVISGEEPTPAK